MKNKELAVAQLKQRLIRAREEGRKSIVIKLDETELEYVRGHGFYAKPHLYTVYTQTCKHAGMPAILKTLDRFKRKGITRKVMYLHFNDRKTLERNSIKFQVFKYKVFL